MNSLSNTVTGASCHSEQVHQGRGGVHGTFQVQGFPPARDQQNDGD
jgi:hypothetical protein